MKIKQIINETLMDGWIKSPDGKNYKLIQAPFDKKDAEILDNAYMVRYIIDTENSKVYAFNALTPHEDVAKRLGLNYSYNGRTEKTNIYGMGSWDSKTNKICDKSLPFNLREIIERAKDGEQKYFMNILKTDYSFAKPYITDLWNRIEQEREKLKIAGKNEIR